MIEVLSSWAVRLRVQAILGQTGNTEVGRDVDSKAVGGAGQSMGKSHVCEASLAIEAEVCFIKLIGSCKGHNKKQKTTKIKGWHQSSENLFILKYSCNVRPVIVW